MTTSLLLAFALAFAQGMGEEPEKPKAAPKNDPEAEAFLKKVDEKFAKAKSAQYKSKLKMEMGDQAIEFDCEGAFKEARFKIELSGEIMGKALTAHLQSDGAKIHADAGRGEDAKTFDAKKEDGEAVRGFVLRGGGLLAGVLAKHATKAESLKDAVKANGLKLGKDEKVGERNCKVLTFTLALADERDEPEVTLWIDAETLAPLKRVLKGDKGENLTETYSDWKLEVELKDEAFALPK